MSDDLLRKILGHVFFPDIYAAQACRRIQELVRPRIQMALSNLHGRKYRPLKAVVPPP